MPRFAHVSLILAPDRSKLSKRHGATSVGQVIHYYIICLIYSFTIFKALLKQEYVIFQFKDMGFLPQAMVNYLALLGWGDGTDNEFFTLDELG